MRTLLRWIMVFIYLKHRDGMPLGYEANPPCGQGGAFAQSF
ncbi:Hypothetical protein GbCGDNIH2_5033 [Granulibacter bethesdensis]|uniref:Uncharacterized protein n=2 Tax=Granulibacter bethesdensis TaxID=364410 RepID=A0A286M2Y3_GRABC|nr:Hypothetical protein GbCGDNIH3_5033 [Granulibacter bethesdensis]AHJ65141.1 Hypothetical protein GbCGDNIH4_5033 [Granulibacter bethesdensis CGDNIH4]ASV62382.1 Hypothetical protein GbCGDNIH1_5033 [Granulibacter bethesdensis CGDNIH1]AHJ67762.1 Hypothetical protein GbCGDNIH2_5033 [Granulibacter bethesdensis]APH51422.1 Hypothetical protein GbCGDNIH5_5033 [Granulibacter bethesdensis]